MTAVPRLADADMLSREIADAAAELAARIDLGEFDDLDEGQLLDLRALSDTMAHWAILAQALEGRIGAVRQAPSPMEPVQRALAH